jgi:hypothetical protein
MLFGIWMITTLPLVIAWSRAVMYEHWTPKLGFAYEKYAVAWLVNEPNQILGRNAQSREYQMMRVYIGVWTVMSLALILPKAI